MTKQLQTPNTPEISDEQNYAGPNWDNSKEYTTLSSDQFAHDMREARNKVEDMRNCARVAESLLNCVANLSAQSLDAVDVVAKAIETSDSFETLSMNLSTFVNCILSLDGGHAEARQMQGELQNLFAEAAETMQPINQLLVMASEDFVTQCFQRPSIAPHEFSILQRRWLKPHLLTLPEETLCTRLNLNGPTGWGTLYTNISTSLECKVETTRGVQTMGIARATGLLKGENREERKAAYNGINSAWRTQQESCASILNALAGWRLDLYKRRSSKQEMHFLDSSLHAGRISRATLDAMMMAVDEAKELGQKALQLRARALKVDQLAPWDLFAPAPAVGGGESRHTFETGLETIRSSFAEISPEMGAFVNKMGNENWIEGSVGDKKRPGAYCTSFRKSRTPRVYMTYRGTKDDIGTLAHELGHAFHNWVMRDLPAAQISYPMTLAETASIFAETLVNDKLAERSNNPQDLLPIVWNDVSNIDSLLLNIPARFAFEKEFYERRSGKMFNPNDFCDLMRKSWQTYYGNSLSEMDDMFWCSKLHFHISGTTFYNFPYTFGYLFSLGIYAHGKLMGEQFYPAYVALLRDTGRMTAEDLAQKHLGVDLSNPHFWRGSIAIARTKIALFECVLNDCGL